MSLFDTSWMMMSYVSFTILASFMSFHFMFWSVLISLSWLYCIFRICLISFLMLRSWIEVFMLQFTCFWTIFVSFFSKISSTCFFMFVIAFWKLKIISVLISSSFAFSSLSLLIIFKCVLNVSALAAAICAHVFDFVMNVTAFMIVLMFFFIVFM